LRLCKTCTTTAAALPCTWSIRISSASRSPLAHLACESSNPKSSGRRCEKRLRRQRLLLSKSCVESYPLVSRAPIFLNFRVANRMVGLAGLNGTEKGGRKVEGNYNLTVAAAVPLPEGEGDLPQFQFIHVFIDRRYRAKAV